MKNRFFNYLLALVLSMCFTVNVTAQNIQAEAKLQQYTIRIGDQTKLFLSVHQPVKEHITFPKLTDTVAGKVQLISTNKPDTTFDQNDRTQATITQSYTITSFDAGTYTIPPFTISTNSGAVKTNELTLQVQTVKVDTTKAIYDIKQPLAVSYSFIDWLRDNWIMVVLVLACLLIIAGLIYYLRKRPTPAPVARPAKPSLPGHIVALSKLSELNEKKLWQQGEVKLYYSELSDILRDYLESRYHIKTQESTTDEIFAALKYKHIAGENWEKLREILLLADLVKFAKEKPLPAENDQSMDYAVDFVSNTKQDFDPALNTGGGGTNGDV